MNIQQAGFKVTAALALCLAVTAASAAPLSLDHVTAPDAAAQLSAKFGVQIVLQGHFNRYNTVSFVIEDADAPGGRLQAVNALANALGADFNKEFIIQKAPDGPDAAPRVDTTASMPFSQKTYSAKDAIAMVAGLDDATAQGKEDTDGFLIVTGPSTIPLDVIIASNKAVDVSGTVTLSSPTLTVAQAAAEIATQTHTRWQTVYVLSSRIPARTTGGTVIGRTNGGSAIVELASVYYHDAKWQARQQQIAQAQQAADAAQQAADQQAAQAYQQAVQQGIANPAATNASAYNPANVSQYGNSYNGNGYGSPYQYGGNYSGNGGYNSGSGLVISGNSYFGNSPAYFGPGSY